jgi:prevent-host-death family protein
MIVTLRESKANLSQLVERAAKGEEILITVHGRPKAQLIAAPQGKLDGWVRELEELQNQQTLTNNPADVLSQIREDRW